MPDTITAEIVGAEEVVAKLKLIKADTQRRGGRRALRKAAQVIVKVAQFNAQMIDNPQTARNIAANITERWSNRYFKATGNMKFRIGVLGGARANLSATAKRKAERRRQRNGTRSLDELGELAGAGKGNPGGDTFYWRFHEFGAASLKQKTPFLIPAMEFGRASAVDTYIIEMNKTIDRAIKRAAKEQK